MIAAGPDLSTSIRAPEIRARATLGPGRIPNSFETMSTDPLVSILIPAFNAERWIADTL
jgi:hypothetical protein